MSKPEIPNVEDQSTESGENSDFDGLGSVPTFGLSKKQLALIGAVVIAVVVWKLYQRDGDSGSVAEEIEEVREPDLDDVKVTEDEDAEEVEVRLPTDPDDELEKDEAVIEHLKETGHISGGEGD